MSKAITPRRTGSLPPKLAKTTMAKTRDDVMCIRIPSDEKATIKEIADTEDRSMTDMVLFFMRSGVAAYQASKAPAPAPAPVAKAPAKAPAKPSKAKAKK